MLNDHGRDRGPLEIRSIVTSEDVPRMITEGFSPLQDRVRGLDPRSASPTARLEVRDGPGEPAARGAGPSSLLSGGAAGIEARRARAPVRELDSTPQARETRPVRADPP